MKIKRGCRLQAIRGLEDGSGGRAGSMIPPKSRLFILSSQAASSRPPHLGLEFKFLWFLLFFSDGGGKAF